ncbi:MAG TPA: pyridoxamine 5'-phosphate oxidase family protein [Sporichthyaceae bacterium]
MSDSRTEISSLRDASGYRLSEERQAQLLEREIECVFGWTNLDGHPIGITQAFVYRDGVFWMCTERSRARARAIERDPRSCVTVFTARKSRTMSFKGTSEILDDRETVLWFLREIARRYDPEDPQAQEAHIAAADHPGRAVIKFTPETITNAFDGGLARRRTGTS